MKRLLFAALLVPCLSASAADLLWRRISGPAQPSVELAAAPDLISVRAKPFGGAQPSVEAVAWRGKGKVSTFAKLPGRLDVSEKTLGKGPLKLWLHVRWLNADGSLKHEETILSPAFGAARPTAPDGMETFDLEAFIRESEADASRIRIPVKMPIDGKATVVIDDADGRRVRNLVNARPLGAGKHVLEWDGRREDGTLAAPGTYRVRTATHNGLSYELQPTFGNGGETNLWACYGPNHTAFRSLVARPGAVSASAFYTEGGNSTDVFDEAGNLQHGWGESWSFGNEALFHVTGDHDFFYSVREAKREDGGVKASVLQCFGYSWTQRHRPEVRIDTPDAKRIPGEGNALRILPLTDARTKIPTLRGATLAKSRLYVSDALAGGLAVFPFVEKPDENRAEVKPREALIPLSAPGPVCKATDGAVLVADGKRLLEVVGVGTRPLCTLSAAPVALAADRAAVYALVEGSHQIHVFDRRTGAAKRTIGEPGGPYRGPWRKDRLVNPTSICLSADGRDLWVTEERMSPKRLSRWNPATGRCVYEKLGSESYGSPGAGMDPEDPNHWIAQDCEWRLDPKTGEGKVVAVLHPETRLGDGSWNSAPIANRSYRWVRRGGRTFVIGNSTQTTVYEHRDSRLVPLAMVTTPGIFSYTLDERRKICKPIVDAYRKTFPGTREDEAIHDEHTLMVWLDRNGNELIDADELAFAPRDTDAGVGFWGLFLSDLDFSVTLANNGGVDLLTFEAGDMKTPGSLPRWSIENAWKNRRRCPTVLPAGAEPPRHCEGVSTASGTFMSIGASPFLLAYDRDGTLRWHMKNPYPNVHQSHAAPLPIPGELQAVLFPHGSVPVPTGRELVSLMGNHGRVFFVTSDGLFLDELFTDCRVSERADETCVGGEAFGGGFQLDRVHKVPVLQAGGGGYRHYLIHGTETLQVADSSVTVTAEQLEAAERLHPVVAAADRTPPAALIPRVSDPAASLPRLAAWSSGNWKIELDAGWDAKNLYLRYNVSEPSPWTNRGEDPYLMFKTGDCIDLQLGVPGLLRLLVAPSVGGKDDKTFTVARYRHQLPAGEKSNGHPRDFNSPTRRYTVDDATLLDDVKAELVREGQGHYKVRLAIPLAELGLDPATLAGKTVPADFGVIFGDREGTVNLSRVYWANKETGLVNDVPGEMMPAPNHWGTVRFAGETAKSVAAAGQAKPVVSAKLVPAGYVGATGQARREGPLGRYACGPAFDARRGLLYASAGDGFVAAYRLDGTRVGLHALPAAPAFARFDTMTLAADGTLFVLAGGSVNTHDGAETGGVLYRLPADSPADAPAEKLPIDGVNAMAVAEHEGRIVLHCRRRELVALDVQTLETSPVAPFRAGGFYLVNAIDHSPDGRLRVCFEHKYVHTFEGGRESEDPKRIFGPREVSMDRARYAQGALWTLQGDTIKRFDARTFVPAPGVVHGGSSGAFIGEVEWNHEMELSGFAPIGKNLFAVQSSRTHAVYLLRWNATARHLDEIRRIGPVDAPGALLLDESGFVFADGCTWRVGDSPLAPPRATGHARARFGGATLPDGTAVAIEHEGGRLVFRHGPLGELGKMSDADARLAADGQNLDSPFAGATVEPIANGYRLTRWGADGKGLVFTLDTAGKVRENEGVRAASGPAPCAASAWATDGRVTASVNTDAGTVTIADARTGKTLDTVKGLARPDRITLCGTTVVVREAETQRLVRYRLRVN